MFNLVSPAVYASMRKVDDIIASDKVQNFKVPLSVIMSWLGAPISSSKVLSDVAEISKV